MWGLSDQGLWLLIHRSLISPLEIRFGKKYIELDSYLTGAFAALLTNCFYDPQLMWCRRRNGQWNSKKWDHNTNFFFTLLASLHKWFFNNAKLWHFLSCARSVHSFADKLNIKLTMCDVAIMFRSWVIKVTSCEHHDMVPVATGNSTVCSKACSGCQQSEHKRSAYWPFFIVIKLYFSWLT